MTTVATKTRKVRIGLEYRDRIDRRTGAADDPERRDAQLKRPAAQPARGFGETLEAEVVEQVQTHRDQTAGMDRPGPDRIGQIVEHRMLGAGAAGRRHV